MKSKKQSPTRSKGSKSTRPKVRRRNRTGQVVYAYVPKDDHNWLMGQVKRKRLASISDFVRKAVNNARKHSRAMTFANKRRAKIVKAVQKAA